jgi:AbrB family looped-hinge helix DNA binding protein
MTVKVSPKYQVVIPEPVRVALGIRAGSKVDVIAKGKVAFLVPVPSLEDVQADLADRLTHRSLRDKKDRAL